jgi:hypothetical protein
MQMVIRHQDQEEPLTENQDQQEMQMVITL